MFVQTLMAVSSQAVMMIPWPSPGEEWSEQKETERRSVGRPNVVKKKNTATDSQEQKDVGREVNQKRSSRQPEDRRGETRRTRRGKIQRGKIIADCELCC